MKKFTILIIDNQVDNIISLESILEKNDFEIKNVQSEQEALWILKDEMVDLVFIDINLPHQQGFSICHTLKSNAKWSVIPVIFIVGMDDLSKNTQGRTGDTTYIGKL